MNNNPTRAATATVLTLLVGCSHPLEIVGDGDILAVSGSRSCTLEEYRAGAATCEKNYVAADYDETQVFEHLKGENISVSVDLGVGRARSRVWTCDLTHEYIRINADYRT